MTDWENSLCRAIALGRITQIIPNIRDPLQSPVKDGLFGLMLPGLHLLTIVSVLDEALADYVEIQEVPWPPSGNKRGRTRLKWARATSSLALLHQNSKGFGVREPTTPRQKMKSYVMAIYALP